MASIQNVPILKFDFDGNLDNTLKFQIDTDASVYGACTGQGATVTVMLVTLLCW